MSLLTLLDQLRGARRIDDVVAQVARQAYVPLRRGCELLVPTMTRAEARGYIWAKAQRIVTVETTAVAGKIALPTALQATVSGEARDRVVQDVLGDLMRERLDRAARRRAA